jgi:bifunctional non-homologous end joining protein LigD
VARHPEQQLRKADVIAYYAAVSERMLPQIASRPLTLVPRPNGAGTHDVVERIAIAESDETTDYMMVRDLKGLLALPQLGVLEIHVWGCHSPKIEQPDKLVFDLDPDPAVAWDAVIEAAIELRSRLNDLGLTSFAQTTGGKGLHVVAPLTPRLSWDEHKEMSRLIASAMADDHPKQYSINQRKNLRKGRVFLDYLRNGRGAMAIAPYSTRAHATATVAAPITWDELMAGAQPSDFTLRSMMKRISKDATDPWAGYAELKQRLGKAALRTLR